MGENQINEHHEAGGYSTSLLAEQYGNKQKWQADGHESKP
jgi:hypothetical protein